MIRNWDYREAYQRDREQLLALVDEVFSSGRLILGPRVQEFEKNFASFCDAAYGVGVNSGTDAIFLALKALGIGPNDEVITVANTAVPTVSAIRATGALPVFVDVEEDTFLLDVEKVEPAVSPRSRAIVPVHLFGQMADMDPLLALASRYGLLVVEDCAQACGASYQGRKAGALGELGAFSFYPTKVLGGFGDGGMVITSSEERHDKLKRLRFYGMDQAYYSEEEGFNSRLDEVQAAFLDFKLRSFEESVNKRRGLASLYARELAGTGDLVLPATRDGRSHQFYVYTVRTKYRDRLVEHLREKGVEARINYPVPVHRMRGYAFLGYRAGALPITERLAGEIVSLPLFPELSEDAASRVIDAVRSFFKQP